MGATPGKRTLMKIYDIFGVGSALVDIESLVPDKILSELNISKGSMSLIDATKYSQLMRVLSPFQEKAARKCGGSACNSIAAASSFGAKTFFSGKVADDSDGRKFASELKSLGVEFNQKSPVKGQTGKCLVLVTEDAERTMCTLLGASELLSNEDFDLDALKSSRWFYIEGFLLSDSKNLEMFRCLVLFAKKHKVKVAINLSDSFLVKQFSSSFEAIFCEGIDLIIGNEEESFSFTNSTNIRDALKALKKFTRLAIITSGSRGCDAFDGKEYFSCEGQKVSAVNTNGAGDMFAGAFLYANTAGMAIYEAIKFANFCASKVVTQHGPRLTSDQCKLLLSEYEQVCKDQ